MWREVRSGEGAEGEGRGGWWGGCWCAPHRDATPPVPRGKCRHGRGHTEASVHVQAYFAPPTLPPQAPPSAGRVLPALGVVRPVWSSKLGK